MLVLNCTFKESFDFNTHVQFFFLNVHNKTSKFKKKKVLTIKIFVFFFPCITLKQGKAKYRVLKQLLILKPQQKMRIK